MALRRWVGVGLFGACTVACGADGDSGNDGLIGQSSEQGSQTAPEQSAPEQTEPELGVEQPMPAEPEPMDSVLGLDGSQVSPPLTPLLPQGAGLVGLTISPAGEYYVLDVHSG